MKAKLEEDRFTFFCPGCDETHQVYVNSEVAPYHPVWEWNQSLEFPTITPSIKVEGYDVIVDGKRVHPLKYDGPYPCERAEKVCHSYITNGQIVYCTDCTHELNGLTVDLPDVDF